MRKFFLYLLLSLPFLGCSGDDEIRQNPYLQDISFTARFDLNLPEYNSLNFPGNHFVTTKYGIKGIVIYNLNNSQYLAFELTDPNHVPQSCSLLTVKGIEASCSCDENVYNIVTGQLVEGEGQYSLKPYRAILRGSILEVSN
ncbi:hypothetical protein [Salinimicrobium gaetbulicola]|uniref:Nitrite reductase/ring-hydroxylating ferredoxin subunit n=1 Tax=Salinimicrobium gaetbulicola TaxID=999702 RepID=A0ABW3IHM0_9FLAO